MKWRTAVSVVAIPLKKALREIMLFIGKPMGRSIVISIPLKKALLMCPYVSSGKFWVLATRCSDALLHSLQPTSDHCLIFASHVVTGMILAIAIISRLLCLQETRGSFKYFPKNALLSFCHNMQSAVLMPCAGWLIFSCSALAHTHDFKNFLIDWCCFYYFLRNSLVALLEALFARYLSKCSAARSSPCLGTMPYIVLCVCSPLCHHLHTIFHIVAWVCIFVCKHL